MALNQILLLTYLLTYLLWRQWRWRRRRPTTTNYHYH